MRRRSLPFHPLAPCLLATLLMLPVARPAAAAAPKVIKLATLVPAGSLWDKELKQLAADVQKRTDNRVTVRIYPGGIAGDDPDMVRKMRLGQLQAASLSVEGLTALDKGFSVFSIPRFFASFDELYRVAHALQPTLADRLDQQGFVFLGWGYGGSVYWFTKTPVYTPDDMKKLKLFTWAGDNTKAEWWKRNGYKPVPLASTDIMTGLQTGMIEALPAPALVAVALQWYRQAPNMFDLPMGQLVGATVISKQAWQQLTPADQAAVRALAGEMQQRLEQAVPTQDRQAVEEMQRRGLNLTKPKDAAALKAWDDVAQQFAATMGEQMVPKDVLDLARRTRDELRGAKH
jgi:TRAP-type C4-dicarboxylate transport system substrate-binding protein